jgi:hypothetical protein
VITLAVLAIHPSPECFDCEYSRQWGRDDAAFLRSAHVLDVWFLLASIVAGFYSVRKYWAIPVLILIAHLVTQPLGGVPLWSLWNNEGPVIVIVGCVVGACALLVGAVIRCLAIRSRN